MASAVKTILQIATDTSESAAGMLARLKSAKAAGKAVDDLIASLEASIKNIGDLSRFTIKEDTVAGKAENKITEGIVSRLTKDLSDTANIAKKSVDDLAEANPTDAEIMSLKADIDASVDGISKNISKLPAKADVQIKAADSAITSAKTGKINTKALIAAGGITAATTGVLVANMLLVNGATFNIISIDIIPHVDNIDDYLIVTYNTMSDKNKKIRLSLGDTVDFKNLTLYPDITGLDIYNPVYGDDTSTLMVLKSKMIPKTQNVYICYDPKIKTDSVSCGSSASMTSHTTFANEITQLFTNPDYVDALISNDPAGAEGIVSGLITTFGSTINAIMVMVLWILFGIGIVFLAYIIWKWTRPSTTIHTSSFGRVRKR